MNNMNNNSATKSNVNIVGIGVKETYLGYTLEVAKGSKNIVILVREPKFSTIVEICASPLLARAYVGRKVDAAKGYKVKSKAKQVKVKSRDEMSLAEALRFNGESTLNRR